MACDILGAVSLGIDAKSTLETLERLRTHIKELQKQCWLLEKELVVQNRSVGSIRAIPNELLAIIFGFYVREKPQLVRRLMLVCRQWHDVAIHNPQFWTSIKINASVYEGDYQSGANLLRPFLQACVQRSGAALLHIELDFQDVCPWGQYVENELLFLLTNLFPNPSNAIYQWVRDEDWSWLNEGDGDPPGHHSHIVELLHNLGPKDRWGSLSFVSPENVEFADEIWTILAGNLPNLKSLSVCEYPEDNYGDIGIPFSDLSSLEVLKVSSFDTLQIVDPPLSLKHLEVGTPLDEHGVEALNRFTGLRTLKILSSYSYSPEQSTTLTLPMLCELHFVKSTPSTARTKYNLRALEDLFLTDQNESSFEHLPDVQPVHVHWSLDWPSKGGNSLAAGRVLTWYTGAKSMTTEPNAKAAILEVVTGMKRAGKLSAELETLVFQNSFGEVDEIICVNDI